MDSKGKTSDKKTLPTTDNKTSNNKPAKSKNLYRHKLDISEYKKIEQFECFPFAL